MAFHRKLMKFFFRRNIYSLRHIFFLFSLVFVLWSGYRHFPGMLPVWLEELFLKPLVWLLPVLVVLALWTREHVWSLLALLDAGAMLLVNAPFLRALCQARGWLFLLQSCLLLPIDLWVSGLGVLWAIVDYMRGNRY